MGAKYHFALLQKKKERQQKISRLAVYTLHTSMYRVHIFDVCFFTHIEDRLLVGWQKYIFKKKVVNETRFQTLFEKEIQ